MNVPRALSSCMLLVASACAPMPPSAAPLQVERSPVFAKKRVSMAEASEQFQREGVQPGQALPKLALLALDGTPVDLDAMRAGRPMVLVTCSLTCNVARRSQANVAALQQRLGERAFVVMIYTIDAHPKTDASPYTGDEWVPRDNEQDGVLVRQPATLAERLALAERYASTLAKGTTVLVDTMADSAWMALGRAPNVGIAVAADGVVVARSGWFDPASLEPSLRD